MILCRDMDFLSAVWAILSEQMGKAYTALYLQCFKEAAREGNQYPAWL